MLVRLASLLFAACACACGAPSSQPCAYESFDGAWSGAASYAATTSSAPTGIAGASGFRVTGGGEDCEGTVAQIVIGECKIAGNVSNGRSIVFEPPSSACTVKLAEETLLLRVREGSARIDGNDTLDLTLGAELLERNGQSLQNATIAFTFEGRK